MKRTELEEKSGLSYAYLSEIEKGRKYPSQAAIAKLAEALGMTPFELWPERRRLSGPEAGPREIPSHPLRARSEFTVGCASADACAAGRRPP